MTVPEFIYTVVLKPKPLRKAANAIIKRILPKYVRYGPAAVRLNPNDPVVSGALTFRVYEKDETAFLRSVFFPGMVLLDIGANVGYYTALGGHKAGSQGRVIALEPDPENFKYLSETVKANGLKNARCIQVAAADHVGSGKLYVSANNRGDNRLYSNELASSTIEIRITTIDALLGELGVEHVDIIKIDVQGAEGLVLKGMKETLRDPGSLIVLTEFWPDGLRRANTDPKKLLLSLEESGLQIYQLGKNGSLDTISDHDALINRYPGRKYTNIVARRI